MKIFLVLVFSFSLFSCSPVTKYYVVRHAEKAGASPGMDSRDPDLSESGKQRAAALSQTLSGKNITQVFVTNTIRSRATAAPTALQFNLSPQVYTPSPDSLFVSKLQTLTGAALIVGHSNTVDDLVNRITGKQYVPGDLSDNSFDRLYIITRRKTRYSFVAKRYGTPTP